MAYPKVLQEQKAKYAVVATLCLLAMFAPGNFHWIAAVLVAMIDMAVRRIAQSPKKKEEAPPRPEKSGHQRAIMKATAQMVLVFGMFLSPAQVIAASCSSYYISEITLVSPGDTEGGRVQTFVGFGASKEEAEKNALGSCSQSSSTSKHAWLQIASWVVTPLPMRLTVRFISSTRRRSSASLAAISGSFARSPPPNARESNTGPARASAYCETRAYRGPAGFGGLSDWLLNYRRLIERVSRTVPSRKRRAPQATSADGNQRPTGPVSKGQCPRGQGPEGQCKASINPAQQPASLRAVTGVARQLPTKSLYGFWDHWSLR
jgi:hypothetical protein